jgi:hypothetical protein
MKLSDLFDALSDYSKQMEARMTEWQAQAQQWGGDAERQFKAWTEETNARMKATETRMNAYVSEASEQARTEWDKAEVAFARQVDEVKATVEQARQRLDKASAAQRADVAEAFAASMNKFSLRIQSEAEKATQAAIEARAKAGKG